MKEEKGGKKGVDGGKKGNRKVTEERKGRRKGEKRNLESCPLKIRESMVGFT